MIGKIIMTSTMITTKWLETLYNVDPLLFICNSNDFININFLSKMCSGIDVDLMKSLMSIAQSEHTIFGISISQYILRIMHEFRYTLDSIIYNNRQTSNHRDIDITFSLGEIHFAYWNMPGSKKTMISSLHFKSCHV